MILMGNKFQRWRPLGWSLTTDKSYGKVNMKITALLSCISLLLVGCATQQMDPNQFSGFLSQTHYSKLKAVEVPSKQAAYRYLSPRFSSANYSSVMIDSVIAFPKPEPTEQVSLDTVRTLQSKMTALLEESFAQVLPVTKETKAGVIRVQTAISGVNLSNKALAVYQYIPIALVAATINTAAGGRDQEVKLYIEMQVVDAQSNEVLAVAVREISGEDLETAKDKLEADQLNEGLAVAGADMVDTLKSIFNQ